MIQLYKLIREIGGHDATEYFYVGSKLLAA
jgi:hypothetical protein